MVNKHHKRARTVLLATIVLDIALGVAYGYADRIGPFHGIYCATGTATTVGCDVAPVTTAAYVVSMIMMLTIVPLFASAFAFFTTGLTADHIDVRHEEMRGRMTGHEGTPPHGKR